MGRPSVLRSLLVLALLAGCGAPPDVPAPPQDTGLVLVAIDGRWDFDAAGARAMIGDDEAGLVWMGEARVGEVAGIVAGLDATAARMLGVGPPAQGMVVTDAGGPTILEAAVWPAPRITAAFEMDRVRACDPERPAQLCVGSTSPEGEASLVLQVGEGAADLRFHPDVVELTPGDYPALWSGTFGSPDGESIPFTTAARSRSLVDPPGHIQGNVTPGEWTIRFTLVLNGTRAPGAVAGFVTYRTPGFSAFDIELLKAPSAEVQTRSALAQAQMRSVALEATEGARGNASTLLGALALLAPENARQLLGIRAANATGILLRNRTGLVEGIAAAAAGHADPNLRSLRVLPLRAMDAIEPTGAGWAPIDEADSLAARVAPGGSVRLNGTTLASPVQILALPRTGAPWTLNAGAHWPDTDAARQGISEQPHLVLVSDDLAREAGLDPENARYARLDVDAGSGTRTIFVMGTVNGGPPRTVWASASLVVFLGRPAGARAIDGGVPLAAPESS